MEELESHPRDDEPLLRIIARRVMRGLRNQAVTPGFGRLLGLQASGAAGDALIALALAGSLFFSVPEADARARVALYLGLTMAPFAIVAPLLARVLDRHRGSLRWAMVVSMVGRGTLAWLLATRLDSLYLFPIAFGVLLLSRAAFIVRGAMLPYLVPDERTLVGTNASLSKISALAGIAVAPVGVILIQWPGARTELLFTAVVYYLGSVPALRLPTRRGRRAEEKQLGARAGARSVSVRGALAAAAGMRFLVGFLVFHLAFVLRREEFGSVGLGVLVGSAAFGGLLGAVAAPRLRRRLREEGIVVAALALAGVTGLVAGWWFSLAAAAVLIGAFGAGSGALKVAFDSIVQRETPEGARGWAFARFESVLQLAWVAGGFLPLAVAIPSGPGVFAAGIVANALAVLYTAGRHRVRARTIPSA